jgi:hypothetical protein
MLLCTLLLFLSTCVLVHRVLELAQEEDNQRIPSKDPEMLDLRQKHFVGVEI